MTLYVTDLDGTLLKNDATISDFSVNTLNSLIENGVLRNYMVDRLNGLKMGMAPTGSGRRESYAYAPTSRKEASFPKTSLRINSSPTPPAQKAQGIVDTGS